MPDSDMDTLLERIENRVLEMQTLEAKPGESWRVLFFTALETLAAEIHEIRNDLANENIVCAGPSR